MADVAIFLVGGIILLRLDRQLIDYQADFVEFGGESEGDELFKDVL